MNDAVKKILSDNTWFVGTVGDGPNVVPVGFKMVAEDGNLILADVAMKTTKDNIIANGQIAVTVCDGETKKAYMVKGEATYMAEGPVVDKLNQVAEQIKLPFRAKGAVIVKPTKVLAKHPGPENDQEIEWI